VGIYFGVLMESFLWEYILERASCESFLCIFGVEHLRILKIYK
jgi:hypothetical protein